MEFRVSGEFSSSGAVLERGVLVSPKTPSHKLESRTSNFSPFMAVDLGTKFHVELRNKDLPDSHFCTNVLKLDLDNLVCAEETGFCVYSVLRKLVFLFLYLFGDL